MKHKDYALMAPCSHLGLGGVMVTNYSHDAQCYNNLVLDIEQTGNLQTINIGKEGNPSPSPSLSD